MSIQQDIIEMENSIRQALELFILKHGNVKVIDIANNYYCEDIGGDRKYTGVKCVRANVTVFGNSDFD